jgi:hypothetical protein
MSDDIGPSAVNDASSSVSANVSGRSIRYPSLPAGKRRVAAPKPIIEPAASGNSAISRVNARLPGGSSQ